MNQNQESIDGAAKLAIAMQQPKLRVSDRVWECLGVDTNQNVQPSLTVDTPKEKLMMEALERILYFPVHSEPVGCAYAMQDIADEAIKKAIAL